MQPMKAGLYIHVPFCRVRCPFCDFAITTEVKKADEWERALEREMDRRGPEWALEFDTLYLGGGTPSLLGPAGAARVIAAARARCRIDPGAEVTLEANPGTLGPGEYRRLREAGVNRLSLGLQSFDEEDLRLLGRDHTVAESLEAFSRAREEGFENITVDLIYGLPGRSLAHWEAQIARAAELRPDHVSAYQLTFEPGTPLTRRKERGELVEPDEGASRELFLATRRLLELAGLEQYEVSSFARSPALRSRHNRKYWEGAPYLGLGPSAHSFRDGVRWWNERSMRGWLEAIAVGRDPIGGREALKPGERMLEAAFLGLRTARGLDLARFREEFGSDLRAERGEVLAALIAEGLARLTGEVLTLTAEGLAVADAAAMRLAGGL